MTKRNSGHRSEHRSAPHLIDKVEAPDGTVVVIGHHEGSISFDDAPSPIFIGVPPRRPLIARETELAEVLSRICESPATALHGLPGAGKTALVTTLVHQPELREHFPGGVFWAGLGPTPDIASALSVWANALDAELPSEHDINSRAQRLSVLLQRHAQGEPVLLVIDDVWSWDHAQAFREIDFPNCALLITTRDPALARKFTHEPILLRELTQECAEVVLSALCPKAKETDPDGLRKLCEVVGGLPLALTLIAATLRDHSGQARWMREEISRLLATGEARLTLKSQEHRLGLQGTTTTLRAIVELSVAALSEELQGAFECLGAFAPKPSVFGSKAVFAVWNVEDAIGCHWIRQLLNRGLMEAAGEDQFTMHQVLAAVALGHMRNDREYRKRHAKFYYLFVRSQNDQWRAIEREMGQIRHAWMWTSGPSGDDALTIGYGYAMEPYLGNRGLWKERKSWIKGALDAAQRAKAKEDEGRFLSTLGMADLALGDTEAALEHVELGMRIHRDVCDRVDEAKSLTNLGVIYSIMGNKERALECYQQALPIHLEVGNTADAGSAITNIGNIYSAKRDLKRAREYYERALPIHRDAGNKTNEANTLCALADLDSAEGDKRRAVEYHEQGLALRRQTGEKLGEARTLAGLARAYTAIGDLDKAQECYEKAILIHRDLESATNEAAWVFRSFAVFRLAQLDLSGAIDLLEQLVCICETHRHPQLKSARSFLRYLCILKRLRFPLFAALLSAALAIVAAISWHLLAQH